MYIARPYGRSLTAELKRCDVKRVRVR